MKSEPLSETKVYRKRRHVGCVDPSWDAIHGETLGATSWEHKYLSFSPKTRFVNVGFYLNHFLGDMILECYGSKTIKYFVAVVIGGALARTTTVKI